MTNMMNQGKAILNQKSMIISEVEHLKRLIKYKNKTKSKTKTLFFNNLILKHKSNSKNWL